MPFGMEYGLPSFGWLREHFSGGEGKSVDQLPFDWIIAGGIVVQVRAASQGKCQLLHPAPSYFTFSREKFHTMG